MSHCFEIKESPGKGLGCFATKDIKIGSLILKETPILAMHEDYQFNYKNVLAIDQLQELNKKFCKLPFEQQVLYLNLDNLYTRNIDNVDEISKEKYKLFKDFLLKRNPTQPELAIDKVIMIMQIYDTNAFGYGVGLLTARLNHSCARNAQVDWNKSTKTHDIRATRKIRKGEEILINYWSVLEKTSDRQKYILERYHFKCECSLCNDEGSDLKMEQFLEVNKNRERLENEEFSIDVGKELISCYKEFYKLAKELSIDFKFIEDKILDHGFRASVTGAYFAKQQNNFFYYEEFAEEAMKFAEIGLKISKYMHGEPSEKWIEWNNKEPYTIENFYSEFNVSERLREL